MAQPLIEPLSARELEVLSLVAQGLSNREVGRRLHVAESTVKSHLNSVYSKLGVRNRTQATAKAKAMNLID
jgi:LuxR family maltose regulon positive regulatory protein